MLRLPPSSTPFPYTTLFRSKRPSRCENAAGPSGIRSRLFRAPADKVKTMRHAIRIQPYLSREDRKSTRLNSSHMSISYAVFCLKKKITTPQQSPQVHDEPLH